MRKPQHAQTRCKEGNTLAQANTSTAYCYPASIPNNILWTAEANSLNDPTRQIPATNFLNQATIPTQKVGNSYKRTTTTFSIQFCKAEPVWFYTTHNKI